MVNINEVKPINLLLCAVYVVGLDFQQWILPFINIKSNSISELAKDTCEK